MLDLVKTLKEYPQLQVLILGNSWGKVGGTNDSPSILNGEPTTMGNLMLQRARAVEQFLIKQGIDWKRIKVGVGVIGTTSEADASTSFIIKNQ